MKKIKFCVDQAAYKNIPGHRYIKITVSYTHLTLPTILRV